MVLRISGNCELWEEEGSYVSISPEDSWAGIKRDELEERAVGGNGHVIMPSMECVLFVYLAQQVVEINP